MQFLSDRTPVYVDNETALLVLVTNSDLKNKNFSEIVFKLHYPWLNTTRGYILNNHLVLYVNDYEIPNVNCVLFQYLFTYLPNIDWIGLGCIKGNIGEEWKPRLVVRRNNTDLVNDISSKQSEESI